MFSSPDDQPSSAHGSPANTRGRVRAAKSMLTENKVNRLHNFTAQSLHCRSEYLLHVMHKSATHKLLVEAAMFPETDTISTIISDTVKVVFKRRLVDRVLRHWSEMARGEGFPRRDQIEPSTLGVDWANCFLIAVQSPVRLSYFAACGINLSFAFCPDENLAGLLLSHLPRVLSKRRCLMIEGRARLRDTAILYRGALFPLSDDGTVIDHLLGAANYRPLRQNEYPLTPLVRTKWL